MPSEWASGAGAEHRLGRAAGLGAVGLGVGPELQRHPDHLGPALALQQRGDGAVDAAGHRDQDAPLSGAAAPRAAPARTASARRAEQARCSASAASWAACRLAGVSPPSASSTSSIPIRAASSTGAPSTISATAAVAARVAPQPSASKVTRGDPTALDRRGRCAREIAAGSAAGGAGEGAVGSRAVSVSSRR